MGSVTPLRNVIKPAKLRGERDSEFLTRGSCLHPCCHGWHDSFMQPGGCCRGRPRTDSPKLGLKQDTNPSGQRKPARSSAIVVERKTWHHTSTRFEPFRSNRKSGRRPLLSYTARPTAALDTDGFPGRKRPPIAVGDSPFVMIMRRSAGTFGVHSSGDAGTDPDGRAADRLQRRGYAPRDRQEVGADAT